MAFDLFGASGGTTTTTPKTTTPEPTIANFRQVDQRISTTPQYPTLDDWFLSRSSTLPGGPVYFSSTPAPMSYNILPINYASQAAQPYPVPNIATQPPNISRVPNMPEGYGYAYGFPFRGKQPKGWNIESPTIPDWANNSTGFNWADASAYGSGVDKTAAGSPVKFAEQGKDKGLTAQLPEVKKPEQHPMSTYNPSVVYNQDVFNKYRAGSSTWNPVYRDWFGSGMYNTELRTQDDFNWLAQNYGIGIHDVRAPKYAGTDTGGAEQAAWLQNELIVDWMRKYGRMSDNDLNKMVDYLTQNRPASVSSGPASNTKMRYYYGGGGGGGYNSGGSYTPSWFNSLLSWRI